MRTRPENRQKKLQGFTAVELIIALGLTSLIVMASAQMTANMNRQLKSTSIWYNWSKVLSVLKLSYGTRNGCEAMFKNIVFPATGGGLPNSTGYSGLSYLSDCSPAYDPTHCPHYKYIQKKPAGSFLNFNDAIYVDTIALMPQTPTVKGQETSVTPIGGTSLVSAYAYPVYLWITATRSIPGGRQTTLTSGGTPTTASPFDPNAISFTIYVNSTGTIISCGGNDSTSQKPNGIIFPVLGDCPAGTSLFGPAAGRFLFGKSGANEFLNLGDTGGEELHVLNGSEMPPHVHLMQLTQPAQQSGHDYSVSTLDASGADIGYRATASSQTNDNSTGNSSLTPTIADSTAQKNHTGGYNDPPPLTPNPYLWRWTHPPNSANTSGANGHITMPPYLVVNWCH